MMAKFVHGPKISGKRVEKMEISIKEAHTEAEIQNFKIPILDQQ